MQDHIATLLTLFADVPRTTSAITTKMLHEDDATLIRTIGFPTQFPAWFDKAESQIIDSSHWRGTKFRVLGSEHRCGSVCILVNQEIFPLVIDVDSRAILFAKDDGTADFVNTGLYQFLYCVGCFLQSCKNDFADAVNWRIKCISCDPQAFHDENSAWSVLFEEAIGGMY